MLRHAQFVFTTSTFRRRRKFSGKCLTRCCPLGETLYTSLSDEEGPRGRMQLQTAKIHCRPDSEGVRSFSHGSSPSCLKLLASSTSGPTAPRALIIVMIPGPNTLFVLKTSIVDGRRAGFAAAGVLHGRRRSGFPCPRHRGLPVLAHPEVFFWLKILGAAYLAWWQGHPRRNVLRQRGRKRPKANPKSSSRRAAATERPCAEPHEPESILFSTSPSSCSSSIRLSRIPAISYTILALILELRHGLDDALIHRGATFSSSSAVSSVRFAKLGNTAMDTSASLHRSSRSTRTLRRDKHQIRPRVQFECGMQAVLFCLSQKFRTRLPGRGRCHLTRAVTAEPSESRLRTRNFITPCSSTLMRRTRASSARGRAGSPPRSAKLGDLFSAMSVRASSSLLLR